MVFSDEKIGVERSDVADCCQLWLLIVEIVKNGYSMLLLMESFCGEAHGAFMEVPPSCFLLPFRVYIIVMGRCRVLLTGGSTWLREY